MAEEQGAITIIEDSIDVPRKFPRALGRQPLKAVNDMAEEAARVYRAVAQGKISPKAGNSMVYMLSQISRMVEVAQIEPLLEQVRQLQAKRR